MTHLNWYYIAVAMTVPTVIGLLLAFPFWWKGRMTLGNIAGTAIVFGSAGTVCFPVPSAFTRFAIYAFIGLTEVIALFSLSIVVEERARRRHYAPEWR